ncbi:DNA mismatch repair protein MutS [Metabacillus iocasae]|uniref:DNA mismatch repair protein MutS n=1 Tax=Priestia iocasae TaxID=2291674 RepID=A0ABS2QR74_9BACI|nr:DNA mismatch repair protein MutS [Metabacillus iocasae]MBM7701950.1 DNA mismatch repair protein MutS [Metabacillus iocasae]
MATYTPMIQQYLTIKAEYEDAFLFFRLGDFYEMFFEDATRASQELEITLTSRDGGGADRIPMCGVPYHSAPTYIERLVEKGYKVAICEQVEDPKQAKGVVKREVVQVISPGTLMDEKGLQEKENNFISSVTQFEDDTYSLAFSDLSTGENSVTMLSSSWEDVVAEIYSREAKEIVVDPDFSPERLQQLKERKAITVSYEKNATLDFEFTHLVEGMQQQKLITAFARLINYLIRTQKRSLEHLQPVQFYQINQYMKIDLFSKRNLELTETIRSKGKKGSLLWLLDKTVTAMGGRLLKTWIDRPLLQQQQIENRLNMVETFMNQFFEREELRELLTEVYDLERLAGRVAFGNVNARDLVQLKKSLQKIPFIQQVVKRLNHSYATELVEGMDPCERLESLLERGLKDHPPLSIKEGDIIKDGYHDQLDQYRDASRNGKSWIAALEQREREKTGIKSLKIGYNRVFGYYIEVTKANLHLLPEGMYERKQTLTNAERYITPELKEKETLILEAEDKIVQLEYELFLQIRDEVKTYIPRLQALAKVVSELDVLQCFAKISEERHYTKPVFSPSGDIRIENGRHPVVEKVMNAQEYVPNDCFMSEDSQVLLITGPNMSGKSTYMRQVALTAILGQVGCFVPADQAVLPIFDQVFTRIGAADDLISGQSTFMVEMLETKNAVVNATQSSLILLDEIGRGTSTYDGMALAQAIIEHIHEHIGCKTLFSTHYHELTVLEQDLSMLKNVHVSAIEKNGKVVFLHKIKDGAADKSYGIHVAELAELPDPLIERARVILQDLEQPKEEITINQVVNKKEEHTVKEDKVEIDSLKADTDSQLSFFEASQKETKKASSLSKYEKAVLEKLKELDVLEMTPLHAMNALYELQKSLKKK